MAPFDQLTIFMTAPHEYCQWQNHSHFCKSHEDNRFTNPTVTDPTGCPQQ